MLSLALYRNSCRVYLFLPVPPAVPLWRFTPSHLMGRNYQRPIFLRQSGSITGQPPASHLLLRCRFCSARKLPERGRPSDERCFRKPNRSFKRAVVPLPLCWADTQFMRCDKGSSRRVWGSRRAPSHLAPQEVNLRHVGSLSGLPLRKQWRIRPRRKMPDSRAMAIPEIRCSNHLRQLQCDRVEKCPASGGALRNAKSPQSGRLNLV